MTYYGAKQMADSFRTVRKNTIIIAQEIPADKYAFKATPEVRSVGQLLTHISLVSGLYYQIHGVERRTTLVGFDFLAFMQRAAAEEQKQRSKDEIVELLRSNGDQFAGWLDGLTEAFLAEHVEGPPGMSPSSKTRFEMILSVKEHEMHHRGQLMLIERMIGIVPHLTREMQARIAQMTGAAPRNS